MSQRLPLALQFTASIDVEWTRGIVLSVWRVSAIEYVISADVEEEGAACSWNHIETLHYTSRCRRYQKKVDFTIEIQWRLQDTSYTRYEFGFFCRL